MYFRKLREASYTTCNNLFSVYFTFTIRVHFLAIHNEFIQCSHSSTIIHDSKSTIQVIFTNAMCVWLHPGILAYVLPQGITRKRIAPINWTWAIGHCQQRIPVPIAINVPKVPPPLTIALPTPLSSSRPLNPILKIILNWLNCHTKLWFVLVPG